MIITTHKSQGKTWTSLADLPPLSEWSRRQLDAMGPPIILRPAQPIYHPPTERTD